MEVLAIELEGKREDLQRIQILVPNRHLSLNGNVFGLRRCLRVGYTNAEFPREKIFLDTWDINSPVDLAKYLKPSRHHKIVEYKPVTSTMTRCSDSPMDGLPWDSAI